MTSKKSRENFPDPRIRGPLMRCPIAEYEITYRLILTALVLLRQNSNSHIATTCDSTTIGNFDSCDNPEQCAFPATVAPNNADSFAFADTQRDALQYRIFAVRLRDRFKIDQIARSHINDFQ